MESASILVIEDEQLIRWSLCRRLEQAGHRVLEANSGGQASDRWQGIDLVLLDLRLPDTDGLSLLRRIKHDCPNCPVILMTAYGTPETAHEAETLGAFQVVDKPFSLDRIAELVESALRARAAAG